MSAPVFVTPAAALAQPGDVVRLDGAEGKHAATVQRLAVGESIELVDGAGKRATGLVAAAGEGWLDVAVASVGHDADPRLTLVQALAKGGRDEQAVETATELGVTAVVPWAAERSIVQWRGPKADKGREAWQSTARAAAKQSRRALVPAVAPLVTTKQLVVQARTVLADGARVLVLHEEATAALVDLDWAEATGDVWLVVGPEGGIAPGELEALVTVGAEPVRLGPHVLRASTAGPAALAALAAARGTWSVAHGAARPTLSP